MRFSVIASGSKANCTFVEASGTRLLIDCGLSARETARRLCAIGIPPESIQAIIVTHEHSDHINGVPVFSRKYKVPVFANAPLRMFLEGVFGLEAFETGVPFGVGRLSISPFSIPHDAADPVGFSILGEGLKFTYATDLGRVTPLVVEAVKGSHALVLESNHDEHLLRNCDYPWQLKQRIASTHGHLSNDSAASLLKDSLHKELFHVVLGHLSENSNTPECALRTARAYVPEEELPSISVGSVHVATPLFNVEPLSASGEVSGGTEVRASMRVGFL